jgi:drug/metabolite transporter (DMT)-like permease
MFSIKLLSDQYKGAIYAILSGLSYGFLGYFGVKLMESGLSIYNMLFWRFIISALFIALILFSKIVKTPKDSENAHLKILLQVFFSGALFYAPCTIIYFFSSEYIGTGLAMVIFFTYPAIVMLLNKVFFRVKITKNSYFAFIILAVGMILLADPNGFKFDLVGVLLGVLSAAFYAAYIIASSKITVTPLLSTFVVSSGCSFTCFLLAYLENSFYFPSGVVIWLNIMALAVISTAVPILLFLEALKYITAERASMLSVFEPVFVVIFGVLLLGEVVTTAQIVGIVAVLSGALMTFLS